MSWRWNWLDCQRQICLQRHYPEASNVCFQWDSQQHQVCCQCLSHSKAHQQANPDLLKLWQWRWRKLVNWLKIWEMRNQSSRSVRLDESSVQSPETTEFKSAQSSPIDYSTEPNQILFEPSVPKNRTSTPFQSAPTIASSSKIKLMSRRSTPRNSPGTTPRGSPSRIHAPFQSPRRAISAATSPMMTEAGHDVSCQSSEVTSATVATQANNEIQVQEFARHHKEVIREL